MKKIILFLSICLIVLVIFLLLYLQSYQPKYSGSIPSNNIDKEVEVYFDQYGIPHIYAQSEADAYYAMGYVHASERLFQMELLRRLAQGQLAEILGEKLIETDKFFLSLGIKEVAKKSTAKFMSSFEKDYQIMAINYLNGINKYIEHGQTPLEFELLGIEKRPFVVEDMYALVGYMAFSFAEGFKVDPVINYIQNVLGNNYLNALSLQPLDSTEKIPVNNFSLHSEEHKTAKDALSISTFTNKLIDDLPVNIWLGSNCFVLSPKKSKSGKVLFANDTHIKFGQPSIWYETHIDYPGGALYGNFLAGFPFALVGHNLDAAWGLTMFENDDVDFFIEKINPDNANEYIFGDTALPLTKINYEIKIKGQIEVEKFEVIKTHHGPIINSTINTYDSSSAPIAVWWNFAQFDSRVLQAAYKLSKAQNINEFQNAASMIDAPGLNVTFGNSKGDIAWCAVGKLQKYRDGTNSMAFQNGFSATDEYLGFYDFEHNPKNNNPEVGFLINSNNQPQAVNGILYPGYYAPENRAKRIRTLLEKQEKWSLEELKSVVLDVQSDVFVHLSQSLVSELESWPTENNNFNKAAQILKNWDGQHQLNSVAPTIFYGWLYFILKLSMSDELGRDAFDNIVNSHLMKNNYAHFINNPNHPWWDNVTTPKIVETRDDILKSALDSSLTINEKMLGNDIEKWQWKRKHTLTHEHPLAAQKPLDKIFNVAVGPAPGGIETINNLAFKISDYKHYGVAYGPAMRILIDFADIENSQSILPTGQSGNRLSNHYSDQAKAFVEGQFRKQKMNKKEIQKQVNKLIFIPN